MDLEFPPRHAYEVLISIGGNDWNYVLRTVRELAKHLEEHGEECNMASGSWDGCHSVHIARRGVSPDDYRQELQKWCEKTRTVNA